VRGGVFRATVGLYENTARAGDVLHWPSFPSPGWDWRGAVWHAPGVRDQFADIIYPAMNQIVSEAARCATAPTANGPSQSSSGPLRRRHRRRAVPLAKRRSFVTHVPGLKVVIPLTLTTQGAAQSRGARSQPVSSLSPRKEPPDPRRSAGGGIHHADRAANVSRRGGTIIFAMA